MKAIFFFLFVLIVSICSTTRAQELLITPDNLIRKEYSIEDYPVLSWEIKNVSTAPIEFL